MMSWLEEEIGIPPEPKHPKAVKPAIQTAGGRKTEPENAEREGKRNRDTGVLGLPTKSRLKAVGEEQNGAETVCFIHTLC